MSTTQGQFKQPLINTKLSAPQRGKHLVFRSRLLALMMEAGQRSLTLVCAPAGYGKSTLLTEWMKTVSEGSDGPKPTLCWLSLDEGDNDPILFLRYVVAAFENNALAIGEEVHTMLEAFPTPPFQTILGLLINRLDDLATPACLILDDYQFISNRAIHEGVAFLLDHLPEPLRLVISTRMDPPLPLARLRVRNQLTEIRADELRFTQEEAVDFFDRSMSLPLSPENIGILEQRTEGWIAGLQMAALALQSVSRKGSADVSEFIRAFSGSHHYVLDYLVEEVLSRAPDPVRTFLIRSSILDRLCGPLCAAIVDLEPAPAQELLEQLDRENLFLIALDHERHWYRYHHLFADLLRTRLEHQNPAEFAQYHLRASAWYAQNQFMEEAVRHAFASRDYQQAGRLINQLAESMISRSGSFTLMRWIQQLPDSYVRTQPWMCIALGWAYGYMGRLEVQEDYLREAEGHFLPEDPPSLQKEWLAHICSLRSMNANTRGDFPETIRQGNQALDLIAPDNVAVRVSVGYSLGRAYMSLGDFTRAEEMLSETARLCMQAGVHHVIAPTIAALSRSYRMEGRLKDALAALGPYQEYLEGHNPGSIYSAYCAYLGTIDIYREWNQMERAEELARNALESLKPWNSHNCICPCLLLIARILQSKGNYQGTKELLQEAAQVVQKNAPFGDVRSELDAAWVHYWLEVGEISPAEQWLQDQRKSDPPGESYSIVAEQNEITACRVLIALRQYPEASRILARLAKSAEAGGRQGRLIPILILMATSLYLSKEISAAEKNLEKCLLLAQPEGYLRIFIDAGEPIKDLLLAYLRSCLPNLREYVLKLIDATGPAGKSGTPASQPAGLVEPLTARELEVLHLLAVGCSNRDIAERLVIAEGTVKYYVHEVLGKLEVKTRTQAIARARTIHLIS